MFKMTVKKKLSPKRLSVTLPGEVNAKLELFLRDFADGAVSNDVIAEALKVCFEADKEFCRAWAAEGARTCASGTAEPSVLRARPERRGRLQRHTIRAREDPRQVCTQGSQARALSDVPAQRTGEGREVRYFGYICALDEKGEGREAPQAVRELARRVKGPA